MASVECACRTWTHPGPFPTAAFWPEGEGHHPACEKYAAPPGVEWAKFELIPMPELRPDSGAIFETWIGHGWIPEQLELEPAGVLRAIEILFNPYPPFVRVQLRNVGPNMVTVTGRWICRAKRSTVDAEALRRVLDAIADETRQP